MITSDPRDPRTPSKAATIKREFNIAIDAAGDLWSIGDPHGQTGCACPEHAPLEQVRP